MCNKPLAELWLSADASVMKFCGAMLLAISTLAMAAGAGAQVSGGRTITGCIAVGGERPVMSVQGRLTRRHFPGPPNFESIRGGDEDNPTLILVLPIPICVDDGDNFSNPGVRSRNVHVWTLDANVNRTLLSSVGRRVIITGEGYSRNNALHYAPLVLEAKTISRVK